MQFLSKSQHSFFTDTDKLFLKFMQKGTSPGNAKTSLKKEKEVGRTTILNMKAYYVATVTKIVR
jgi:hypothetical protein